MATLLTQLDEQFSSLADNYLITNVTILDPQIKNIAFSGFFKRKYNVAVEQLKSKVIRKQYIFNLSYNVLFLCIPLFIK